MWLFEDARFNTSTLQILYAETTCPLEQTRLAAKHELTTTSDRCHDSHHSQYFNDVLVVPHDDIFYIGAISCAIDVTCGNLSPRTHFSGNIRARDGTSMG